MPLTLASLSAMRFVAHAAHYTLVFGGLAVVVVLLWSTRPGAARPVAAPRTEHEHRVALLREAASHGRLALLDPPPVFVPPPARAPVPAALPIALISSAAGAGVHAAATPGHLGEGALVSSFFVLAALAQLVWATSLLVATPRWLIGTGLVGNIGVAFVWVLSRTAGLPVGPTAVESIGPWDVAATGWELAVVAACVVLLLRPPALVRGEAADVTRWSRPARHWLVGSVVLMAALTLAGAPT